MPLKRTRDSHGRFIILPAQELTKTEGNEAVAEQQHQTVTEDEPPDLDLHQRNQPKGKGGVALLYTVPTPPFTAQPQDNAVSPEAQNDSQQATRVLSVSAKPRLRPPHMIWDKTINDLHSTIGRVEAFQATNNGHKDQLQQAQTKLNQLLTHVKEIERNKLGVDWDTVVESGKVVLPQRFESESDDEKDGILTRHDIQFMEQQRQYAHEAEVEAVALAEASFDDNSQKYTKEFNAKIQRCYKVPKIEVEEHDTILKEIHSMYQQVADWELRSLDECDERGEKWVTKLANLAVDDGIPPLERSGNEVDKESILRQQTALLRSPNRSVSSRAPRLIIKLNTRPKIRTNLSTAAKASEDREENEDCSEAEADSVAEASVEIRRSTRVRLPSARKVASMNDD